MRWIAKLAAVALLTASSAYAATPQTVILDVPNMTCALCPLTVKKALQKVTGVADAKIDVNHKTAIVTFDPDKVNTAALIKATTDAGYPSTLHIAP